MSSFSIHDLIYQVGAAETQNTDTAMQSYAQALDRVRRAISTHHGAELAGVMASPEAEQRLRQLITRYLTQYHIAIEGIPSVADAAARIYEDMAGFGVITQYLRDTRIEEININGWNRLELVYPDHIEYRTEAFLSPADCVDKVKKMVQLGGEVIDGSHPVVDSYIGGGTRISAIIPPCADDTTGAVASIRRQRTDSITKEQLITYQTATEEELDFLSLCINHGVSLAVAGATGAGKTTDLAYLLSCLSPDKRIYTIEDTREIYLDRARLVQTVTKGEPNPISANDLLKEALRFHPTHIVPAEMRGSEAWTAQEAGRTGHCILTSLHANSAVDAYNRILSMCVQSGIQLSEGKILQMILEAMPLILFKRQLPDHRRVYAEIFEGTGIQNNTVTGHTLYRYEITDTQTDKNGNVVCARGLHRRVDSPSDALIERLRYGGASRKDLQKLRKDG